MPVPERKRRPCADPRYRLLETDDGSLTLECVATGDTFHSGCGALTECEYVYLRNSHLHQEMAQQGEVEVLEMGFGTGMNFLVTAALARECRVQLRYCAVERAPLAKDVLQQVLQFPEISQARLEPLRDELLLRWPYEREERGELGSNTEETAADLETQHVISLEGDVSLELWRGDALGHAYPAAAFAAIYFDPFSPQSNPELWSEDFLAKMYAALRDDGVLVSYCVNSEVRRRLTRIGFTVQRAPGPPGGKREILHARKRPTQTH